MQVLFYHNKLSRVSSHTFTAVRGIMTSLGCNRSLTFYSDLFFVGFLPKQVIVPFPDSVLVLQVYRAPCFRILPCTPIHLNYVSLQSYRLAFSRYLPRTIC